MADYDPPFKALFIVCYSAVAATAAVEAELLGNPDSYTTQPNQELVEEYEKYLANNEPHPWCGFGMDDIEVGYLVPAREGDVHFINEEEYEELTAGRLEKD